MLKPLRRLSLATGYMGSVAIAVLSLLPAVARPHTGAGGEYEHWLAYALVGAAFGLGYQTVRKCLYTGLWLSAGSAVLELLQNFIPGRTPEVVGFVASSLGAWAGLSVAFAALAMRRGVERG